MEGWIPYLIREKKEPRVSEEQEQGGILLREIGEEDRLHAEYVGGLFPYPNGHLQ